MVTGVYYSEDFGEDLANCKLLPRIIHGEVRHIKQKAQQMEDHPNFAKHFLVRLIWMRFFKMFCKCEASDEVA